MDQLNTCLYMLNLMRYQITKISKNYYKNRQKIQKPKVYLKIKLRRFHCHSKLKEYRINRDQKISTQQTANIQKYTTNL